MKSGVCDVNHLGRCCPLHFLSFLLAQWHALSLCLSLLALSFPCVLSRGQVTINTHRQTHSHTHTHTHTHRDKHIHTHTHTDKHIHTHALTLVHTRRDTHADKH